MIKKIDEVLDKTEVPFILFWEFMLIVRMVSLYSMIPSKIDSIIFTLISFVGGMLFLRNGIKWLQKKQKFSFLLILFALALVATSILNGPSGIVANFKLIIWQLLFFFVVFEIGEKNYKKLFPLVEKVLVITWFVLIIISLSMFFIQFSYTAPLDKLYYGIRMGLVENRLYGVFVDPNYGATISVVTIFVSLHLFKEAKKQFYKVFIIISVVCEFLFVILSGSRTALIEIMVASLVVCFFSFYYKKRKSPLLKKIVYSTIIGLLVTSGIYLLMNVTQKAAIISANSISKIIVLKKDETKISLDRKDVDENSDVSNSRFKLWGSAFEIFEQTPIIGTAPKNMVPYAQKHLPKTWIAKKEQTPHNFIFYLLATTGLIGTIPFVIFIVFNIIKVLIHLFKLDIFDYKEYLFQCSMVLIILISACLITDVVLVNKLGTMIFYLYLGKLNSVDGLEMGEELI